MYKGPNANSYKSMKLTLVMTASLIATSGVVSLAAPAKHHLAGRINHDVALADDALAKGKYEEAEKLYHDALNANSNDVAARVGYGMALSRGFKLDRADQELNKALQLDPHNAMAHCGKALNILNRLQSSSMTVVKSRSAMLDQAGSECNQALDIDPKLAEVHYTLGMVFKEQNRLDKAQEAFNGALKLEPKFSDAHAGLGLVSLQQGKMADAISAFQQAISENSGNSTAHFGLGQAYLKQGQIDQSISELNTSLYQNRNSAPVHLFLGRAYDAQGNADAAINEYHKSIAIKPENPGSYIGIANIRESRGDIEHAIAELRSGLDLSPTNPELHLRIAQDSLRLEKLDDAVKEFETVLASAPRSSAAVDGLTRTYYLKAQKEATGAFISTNEFERAQQMIQRAIQMNPNSMQLRLAQAKLRAISGAKVDLSRMGMPTNDPERIDYAEVLLAQNKFQEAKAQMDIVIANANNPRDVFAIGDLALMIKDLDSANAAYQKAMSVPGNEERAKRGLDMVAKARDESRQDLTLANDLSRRKQLASSIDKYHAAIFADPRSGDARLGLAEAEERLYSNQSAQLRDAATQITAFISLTPTLPAKEQEKLQKRIEHLQTKAYKIDQKKVAQATLPKTH
jgi:tetratricopeptide (TPR) repeat protein